MVAARAVQTTTTSSSQSRGGKGVLMVILLFMILIAIAGIVSVIMCSKSKCKKNSKICVFGKCICKTPWTGSTCQECGCTPGHGTCDSNGRCVCTSGWTGATCNVAGGSGRCPDLAGSWTTQGSSPVLYTVAVTPATAAGRCHVTFTGAAGNRTGYIDATNPNTVYVAYGNVQDVGTISADRQQINWTSNEIFRRTSPTPGPIPAPLGSCPAIAGNWNKVGTTNNLTIATSPSEDPTRCTVTLTWLPNLGTDTGYIETDTPNIVRILFGNTLSVGTISPDLQQITFANSNTTYRRL